jgi:glycosyltransferase involved in cell wall biosynthesis
MKILMNCLEMPTEKEGSGGAGKYVQALIPALGEKSELYVICSPRNAAEYESKSIKKSIIINNFDEFDVEKYCKDVDIYFNPTNGLKPLNLPKDILIVTVIHDLQHNHYPHLFSNGGFEGRNHDYGYAISRSDGLIAISNWEKSNFQKYYNVNNVKVIHHSAFLFDNKEKNTNQSSNSKSLSRFSSYYIYPAVAWPHKNHYKLIEAFALLNKKYNKKNFNLVLTGIVKHITSTSLWNRKFKEFRSEDFIDILGHVTDDELITLMSNAKGMIFPSLYEGFGIPIADAMKFGIPIIASDMSAIPETSRQSIEYFKNPHDSFQMAEDILNFDEKINKGIYDVEKARKAASIYSTKHMASELIEYFTFLINSKKSNSSSLASYSTKNLDLNTSPKKVTIIIDLNLIGHTSDDLNNFLNGIINNSDTNIFDYCLIMPYEIREVVDKKLIDEISKIAECVYYQNKVTSSKVMALEHLLELSIKTDYFICIMISQFFNLDYSFIRKAIANLDFFVDTYSCIRSNDKFKETTILRPPEPEIGIRNFNKIFGEGEIMVTKFYNRLIRTKTCRLDGMIGTLASLSKDTSYYSNVEI